MHQLLLTFANESHLIAEKSIYVDDVSGYCLYPMNKCGGIS